MMKCLIMVLFKCLLLFFTFLKKVETSQEFEEFLSFLGDRIKLNGFKGFNGGLDVKSISNIPIFVILINIADDTTGLESVYTKFVGIEVFF